MRLTAELGSSSNLVDGDDNQQKDNLKRHKYFNCNPIMQHKLTELFLPISSLKVARFSVPLCKSERRMFLILNSHTLYKKECKKVLSRISPKPVFPTTIRNLRSNVSQNLTTWDLHSQKLNKK